MKSKLIENELREKKNIRQWKMRQLKCNITIKEKRKN